MSTRIFPSAVQRITEAFDLQVIRDMEEPTEHGLACPKHQDASAECTCPPVAVVALGTREELAAGRWGSVNTPYFHSIAELEDFLQRHLDRFLDLKQIDEDAPAPDATRWDQEPDRVST